MLEQEQELLQAHISQLPEDAQTEFLTRYQNMQQQDKDAVLNELMSMHPEFQQQESTPQLKFGGTLKERYQSGGKKSDPYAGYHGKAGKTKLQKQLKSAGFNIGKNGADGILGKDTGKAVKAFQKANNLAEDGIAGPLTLAALNRVPSTQSPQISQSQMDGRSAEASFAEEEGLQFRPSNQAPNSIRRADLLEPEAQEEADNFPLPYGDPRSSDAINSAKMGDTTEHYFPEQKESYEYKDGELPFLGREEIPEELGDLYERNAFQRFDNRVSADLKDPDSFLGKYIGRPVMTGFETAYATKNPYAGVAAGLGSIAEEAYNGTDYIDNAATLASLGRAVIPTTKNYALPGAPPLSLASGTVPRAAPSTLPRALGSGAIPRELSTTAGLKLLPQNFAKTAQKTLGSKQFESYKKVIGKIDFSDVVPEAATFLNKVGLQLAKTTPAKARTIISKEIKRVKKFVTGKDLKAAEQARLLQQKLSDMEAALKGVSASPLYRFGGKK